jgi:hypothetical protein
MPLKKVSRNPNDRPWVTDHFLELVKKRQAALRNGRMDEYKRLRNIITNKSRRLKKNYYNKSVKNLKDPKQIFKEIKVLTNTKKGSNLQGMANHLCNGNITELASTINNYFSSICEDLPKLATPSRSECYHVPDEFIITVEEVFNQLRNIKPKKSPGPVNLPGWILKDFAELLSRPICSIFNASLIERSVPTCWKKANVCALPKILPPKRVEKHLRPISLTDISSKMMESYIFKWLLYSVRDKIDLNQFGALSGSSNGTNHHNTFPFQFL